MYKFLLTRAHLYIAKTQNLVIHFRVVSLHILPIYMYVHIACLYILRTPRAICNLSIFKKLHQKVKCILFFVIFAEETSSSSEISPGDTRKPVPPPMRKSKGKNQIAGKRLKNNSGYSSHTEETTFR